MLLLSLRQLIVSLVVAFTFALPSNAHWAFLQDQSQCSVSCLNGGVCAFLRENQDVHKCICLIGIWEGERCEQKMTEQSTMATTTMTSADDAMEDSGGEAEEAEEAEEDWTDDGESYEEGVEEEVEVKADERKEKREERNHRRKPEAKDEEEEEEELSEEWEPEAKTTVTIAPGKGPQAPRQFMETNTMAFDEFAESRHHRPVAAQGEEMFEEPAQKSIARGNSAPRTSEKASRKGTEMTPRKRKKPKTETAAGGDGGGTWMLSRRRQQRWRSSSPSTNAPRILTIVGVALSMLAAGWWS